MIYDFYDAVAGAGVPGILPSLAAGTLNSISFAPGGPGTNYAWAGF